LNAQEPIPSVVHVTQHQICLLLGSNIQPERNLPLAVQQLASRMAILRASSVWESPAVGSRGPNFLNAALLCLTSLSAEILKWQVLRPLEARMGRVRNKD
jgi:2-amino-4-hydroxy-6-hydroxymethyldihydropteridine diphosphokinase